MSGYILRYQSVQCVPTRQETLIKHLYLFKVMFAHNKKGKGRAKKKLGVNK